MKEARHSSSTSGPTENRRAPASEHRADSNHQDSLHPARTLAIDVGGTGLKASVLDAAGKMIVDRVWVDTPYPCPPKVMVKALVALVKPLPAFDRISVGFPGYVRQDKVLTAPEFGNDVWRGFDLAEALRAKFGKPVRLLNDADMQGFAAIAGKGIELVVTLGTGVGTALFRDGELMPHLELAHHPVHGGKNYNQYLGKKALKKIGRNGGTAGCDACLEFCTTSCYPTTSILAGGTPGTSPSSWTHMSTSSPMRTASSVGSWRGRRRSLANA